MSNDKENSLCIGVCELNEEDTHCIACDQNIEELMQ